MINTDTSAAAVERAARWNETSMPVIAATLRALLVRVERAEAERDAARAEAARLREALERLCRNQHAPGSLADAFWKAREALAGMEPGHD